MPLDAFRRRLTTTGSWGILPRFLVTFAAVAGGMVLMGRDIYFGQALYETGDLAANSLEINRAIHLLADHANYSRWEFYHPGPAFFYVYGAGEVLFYRLLHVVPAPHNGQLLAGALLQSFFLAAAITVGSRFASRNRGLFAVAAVVVALVHFRLAGDLEFAVWPPAHLMMPFACFVVVSAAVARGWLYFVPLLVLSGGFLAHGHVAQPLFVVPLATVALGFGVRNARRGTGLSLIGLVRDRLRPLLAAVAVLAVFLAPLLRDATRGPDSNLAAIFTYFTGSKGPAETHSPILGVPYVIAFLGYPADEFRLDFSDPALGSFFPSHWAGFALSLFFLVALPAVLMRWRSAERESPVRPLAIYYAILLIAAALCLIWPAIQRGPLYQFNSYFIYGLMFAAALPSLILVCVRWPADKSKLATAALVLVALSLTATLTPRLPIAEDPNGLALNNAVHAIVDQRKNDKAVMLEFRGIDWPYALGVGLALQRCHVRWFVHPRHGLAFGEHAVVPGSMAGIERWFLGPPRSDQPGQIMLGPDIVVYPPPESISTYHLAVEIVETAGSYVAGTARSVTISELDQHGNVAVGYHGTVRFTSSDPAATLPPDYTFKTLDRGVHGFAFQLVLRTPGLQSVTVTDSLDPSITGTQLVLVLAPPASPAASPLGAAP